MFSYSPVGNDGVSKSFRLEGGSINNVKCSHLLLNGKKKNVYQRKKKEQQQQQDNDKYSSDITASAQEKQHEQYMEADYFAFEADHPGLINKNQYANDVIKPLGRDETL